MRNNVGIRASQYGDAFMTIRRILIFPKKLSSDGGSFGRSNFGGRVGGSLVGVTSEDRSELCPSEQGRGNFLQSEELTTTSSSERDTPEFSQEYLATTTSRSE